MKLRVGNKSIYGLYLLNEQVVLEGGCNRLNLHNEYFLVGNDLPLISGIINGIYHKY